MDFSRILFDRIWVHSEFGAIRSNSVFNIGVKINSDGFHYEIGSRKNVFSGGFRVLSKTGVLRDGPKRWSTDRCLQHGDYCQGDKCCCPDKHPGGGNYRRLVT